MKINIQSPDELRSMSPEELTALAADRFMEGKQLPFHGNAYLSQLR
jgi:hypothetical protein